MELRTCQIADANDLAKMNRELIEDEKSGNKMSIKELTERMEKFLNEGYQAYKIFDENILVGYILVDTNKHPVFIRHFFIMRQYRRKGYGTHAFWKLLENLKISQVDIQVLVWNQVGLAFWESIGFVDKERYRKMSFCGKPNEH